jgi:lipoprotein-releasing system permease protein
VLALQLAWRFLVEGRTQTLLIVAGVTIGVAAYVFITATMIGVQDRMVQDTLGAQAHLSVLEEDAPPQPVLPGRPGVVDRTVLQPAPRQTPFDQWQRALARVEATPGVVAACPRLEGAALAVRGGAREAVQLVGADPVRLARVIDLPGHLVDGAWEPGGEQVVIGQGLADTLGLRVGSPMLLVADDRQASVRVVGTFRMGASAVDDRWVVLGLRGAQSLLGRPGDISSIDATVAEVFSADKVAARVAARTGKPVESWIGRNKALLSALSAQDQSTLLIRVFTLLAVAMGIASVLAVTVVQRRGQIGILRAMGVAARVVLQVFLWQGALLGVAGAVLGTALGAAAGAGLELVVPFAIRVDFGTAATATVISVGTGVFAALWPARVAASMDPAAAIRGDGG